MKHHDIIARVKTLKAACEEFISTVDEIGNECAWTDRQIEVIISASEVLKSDYESQFPVRCERAADSVCIYTRDVNGYATTHRFSGTDAWQQAYRFCEEEGNSDAEDEILFVTIDGTTAFSSLNRTPILWEDLVGFFA